MTKMDAPSPLSKSVVGNAEQTMVESVGIKMKRPINVNYESYERGRATGEGR